MLFGCPRVVTITTAPEAIVVFEKITRKHPLPDKIRHSKAAGDNSISIRIEKRTRDSALQTIDTASHIMEVVVATSWYAPVSHCTDKNRDYSMEQINKNGIPIKPVDEICLPETAARINGKEFTDKDYMLTESTILVAESSDPFPMLFEDWFTSIDLPIESPEITWVGAAGDLMAGRGVSQALRESGAEKVFTDTLPIIQSSDFFVVNLEGTLTERTEAFEKSFTFKFPAEIVPILMETGFDYVSLANNHSYDFLEKGFLDTLKNLEFHGLPTSGAGKNYTEAAKPFKTTVGKTSLSILSIGAFPVESRGFSGKKHASATKNRAGILWSDKKGIQAIQNATTEESIDIVMVHGGYEYQEKPFYNQKKLYRSFIDAGADMVIGHHPHVLQGMEVYKDGLIVYSLGNLVFPWMETAPPCGDGLILHTGIYKNKILYIEAHGTIIENTRIYKDTSGRIADHFFALSAEL